MYISMTIAAGKVQQQTSITLDPSSSKALKNETMSSFLLRIALISGGSSIRLPHTMMQKRRRGCLYVAMHRI